MKEYKCIKSYVWIVLIGILLVGCQKMDFNYKQFTEKGETIYVGRPDSLLLRGGNERAELRWLLLSDPKITSYKIYWNNRQDSTSGNLNKTEHVDTVIVKISNLEEKTQEFEIFHYDKNGNSSVRSSVLGKVYGPRYINSLVNRTFKTPKRLTNNRVELNWTSPELNLLFSDITYSDINDNQVEYRVDRKVGLDTLINFPVGGVFDIKSAFKPDSLALDTFYTKKSTLKPL